MTELDVVHGHRLDTRFVEQAVDLPLHPCDGVGRDAAERLPFRLGEVYGNESAGILVHVQPPLSLRQNRE